MPIIIGDTTLNDTTTSPAPTVETLFGVPTPAPSTDTAPALLGSAPTVSTTPTPGQGVALDLNGRLPTTVSNGLLQLVSQGQHKIAFGSGIITYPGGSPFSNVASVTHGLGAKPVICIATMDNSLAFSEVQVSFDATTLQFRSGTIDGSTPAANATQPFYWLAIA